MKDEIIFIYVFISLIMFGLIWIVSAITSEYIQKDCLFNKIIGVLMMVTVINMIIALILLCFKK